MLLGHLAIPTILREYFDLEAIPLYVGSFFPDLVDKTLEEVGWLPNGRNIAHTLFTLAVTTVWVERIGGKASAISWAIGYLGHLVCDVSGLVPWLYPFVAYEFKTPRSRPFLQKVKRAITHAGPLEWALVVWAVVLVSGRVWRGRKNTYI
jgi:hypothetical protein